MPSRSRSRLVVRQLPCLGLLLLASLAASACKDFLIGSCGLVAYGPAFDVTIRDQMGNAQALGAVVTFSWDSNRFLDSTRTDSLNVLGGGPGITYDITVTKRYYGDALVRGIYTPDLGCGNPGPGLTVPVALALVVGAPPVRSLYLLPPQVLLDRSPSSRSTQVFAPIVDASAGVSRKVRWSIAGDTGSVAFDATTGMLSYRCLAKSGYLTVTAASVADSTVIGTASVAVQGHPAASSDPPCG